MAASDTTIHSPPTRLDKYSGIRVTSDRDLGLSDGKTCHQCRHKHDIWAACTNQIKFKQCAIKLCHKCLLNRYGENAAEVGASGLWICPKCRGICNCSVCMKKKGHKPTGAFIKTGKATGNASVSEMLLTGAAELSNNDKAERITASYRKDGLCEKKLEHISVKDSDNSNSNQVTNERKKKQKCLKDISNGETCLSAYKEKMAKRKTLICEPKNGGQKKHKISNKENNEKKITVEGDVSIQLPVGKKLISICGVDVNAKDAGNALQLLEFCFVFGKILNIRKSHAEHILRDLLHGRFSRHGRFSVVGQFIVHLLSSIQAEEQGHEDEMYGQSSMKGSWFRATKKILLKSRDAALSGLENAADFETLDASLKLRILNRLCDEVLETKMVRNWMDKRNTVHAVKIKGIKQKLVDAKDKEKTLTKKMRDITNAEPIISRKTEQAQAHTEVLNLKAILSEISERHEAIRLEPVYRDQKGHVFWRPNCLGRSTVIHQDLRKEDSLGLDDEWFILDDEEKEAVEKHISGCRGT